MREKLSIKLDYIFWWLVWLVPLLLCLIGAFGKAQDYTYYFGLIENFKFSFIFDLFTSIENTTSWSFPPFLKLYASYLASAEIIHVLVDIVVFIPRVCHKVADPSFWDRRLTK